MRAKAVVNIHMSCPAVKPWCMLPLLDIDNTIRGVSNHSGLWYAGRTAALLNKFRYIQYCHFEAPASPCWSSR